MADSEDPSFGKWYIFFIYKQVVDSFVLKPCAGEDRKWYGYVGIGLVA